MKARLNSHELPLYYHHGTEAIIFDFENDQAREIPSSPEE